MAHSSNLALYAFTQDCEIGVDVEKMRRIPDLEQIADRYFCSAERSEVLSNKDTSARHEAFFRCWTRKEAYIKATGDGLSLPLSQFDVSLGEGEQNALLATRPDAAEASHWLLRDVPGGPGFMAALCVRGQNWKLKQPW
jgi:4'-phosphopantetheinyl transferase